MVRWTSPGSRWTISMPSVAMTCCRAKLARTRSRKLGSGGWNTSQSLPANDDVRQETLSSSANDGNSHCWTGRSASRQLGLEERHGAGVEVGMEGRAIEPFRIVTDERHGLGQRRRAGREECEVPGIRHDMIFGLGRQIVVDILGVARVRQDFIVIPAPELDRDRDRRERFCREGIADRGRRNDCGLDAGIVDEANRITSRIMGWILRKLLALLAS